MIDRGARLRWLGTERLTWRDLRVIVKHAPRKSAMVRSVNAEAAEWGVLEQILAKVADDVAWLKWAKTEDGQRNQNHPERIPRPGVSTQNPDAYGNDPLPADEMVEWLGWG